MYHLIIYEENNIGYLLADYPSKIPALNLYKRILDDFAENDYLFSDKDFNIREFPIKTTYSILTHKIKINSNQKFLIHKSIELKNGYLYHLHSKAEIFEVKSLPRENNPIITAISNYLNAELEIHLN